MHYFCQLLGRGGAALNLRTRPQPLWVIGVHPGRSVLGAEVPTADGADHLGVRVMATHIVMKGDRSTLLPRQPSISPPRHRCEYREEVPARSLRPCPPARGTRWPGDTPNPPLTARSPTDSQALMGDVGPSRQPFADALVHTFDTRKTKRGSCATTAGRGLQEGAAAEQAHLALTRAYSA